ncbi:cytochrome P450, partial [Lophiotrema nucula]
DIASGLVGAAAASSNPTEAHRWLRGDSHNLTVAVSDAVASSLTFAFYYLAQNPSHTTILRKELEAINDISASALQAHAPYLNAFITEVLRVRPPNPSGVLRQIPKEGVHVGNTYIPGDVTVCTPFWAMQRCE